MQNFILVFMVVIGLGASPSASANPKSEDVPDVVVSAIETLSENSFVEIENMDEAAIAVLDKLVVDQALMESDFLKWIERLERQTLTVTEHSAISYIVRTGFIEQTSSPEIGERAKRILERSWINLTGLRARGSLTDPLPKSVLRKASRQARLIEISSFNERSRDREVVGLQKRVGTFRDILNGYVPHYRDAIVPGLMTLATVFSQTGAKVVASAIVTYAVVSIVEALIHRNLAHQKISAHVSKLRDGAWKRFLQRKAGLLRTMDNAFFHHVIGHHASFSDSYVEMWRNPKKKESADARIAELNDRISQKIVNERYGITLDLQGRGVFMATLFPIQLALSALTNFDPACTLTIFSLGFVYPFNSADFHPNQHKESPVALREAGPLMRLYLKTRATEALNRRHWLHHHGPVNYNLAPLNFGDLILGTLIDPTLKEALLMRREKILGAYWELEKPSRDVPTLTCRDLFR